MIFNNFFYQTTFILILINIFRNLLGLINQIVIAASFGASASLDAYLLAFSIPQIFGDFFGGGVIFLVLIPLFIEYKSKNDETSAWDLISSIINIFTLILCIIMLFYIIFAPFWIRILAPGFTVETSKIAIGISRILSPLFILTFLVWVANALLHSYNNFIIPALSASILPITVIIFVTLLSRQWGIYSLAGGILMGSSLQLLMQWFVLPKNRYRLLISFSSGVKRFLFLCSPILTMVIIYNLTLIFQRFLASKLSVGTISALNFANYVINLFITILCMPLVSVIFPLLSSEILEGNGGRFKNTCVMGLKLINFTSLPATIYLLLFCHPLTRLIFNRGNFGMEDVNLTSEALFFLSFGFFATCGMTLLNRIFFSLKDMISPLKGTFIASLVSLPLNYFFCKWLGIKGLGLATSITVTIIFILLLYRLHKKTGLFRDTEIIISFIKTLIISILAGVSAFGLYNYCIRYWALNLTTIFLLSTLFAFTLFILLAYIFKINEIKYFLKAFLKSDKNR